MLKNGWWQTAREVGYDVINSRFRCLLQPCPPLRSRGVPYALVGGHLRGGGGALGVDEVGRERRGDVVERSAPSCVVSSGEQWWMMVVGC